MKGKYKDKKNIKVLRECDSSYQMEENSTSTTDESIEPIWSFSGLSLKKSLYKKKKNVDVFEDVRRRLLKFKEDWNLWLLKD